MTHLGSLLSQSYGLIWGSAGEGFTSKIMWLLSAFSALWAVSLGSQRLTSCQPETVLSFLPSEPSQYGHFLPQIQQGRESPCKMDITLLCNAITKATNLHHSIFYWLEESYRPSPQSRGVHYTGYEHQKGRDHWDHHIVYLPASIMCPRRVQNAFLPSQVSTKFYTIQSFPQSPEPYLSQTHMWMSLPGCSSSQSVHL